MIIMRSQSGLLLLDLLTVRIVKRAFIPKRRIGNALIVCDRSTITANTGNALRQIKCEVRRLRRHHCLIAHSSISAASPPTRAFQAAMGLAEACLSLASTDAGAGSVIRTPF
jgi:hypothetical protein